MAASSTGFFSRDSVDARVIMETLGHSQISLTLDTYAHVLVQLKRVAADYMDAMFAKALTGSSEPLGGQNGGSHRQNASRVLVHDSAEVLDVEDLRTGEPGRNRTFNQQIKSPTEIQISQAQRVIFGANP
jgi:hypothetical protein